MRDYECTVGKGTIVLTLSLGKQSILFLKSLDDLMTLPEGQSGLIFILGDNGKPLVVFTRKSA